MQYHEAAMIFPMDEDSLQELADDIAKQGLLHPIEIMDGKILDGRRRSAACVIAGVEPDYSEVNPVDPVAYVLSLNLHRRHLSQPQKAMVAAKALEVYERQAKDRQRQSPGRGKKVGTVGSTFSAGKATEKAGEALGVSGRSVIRAKRVQSEGAEEVTQAVEAGKISLSKAEEIVRDYPKQEQPNVLKSVLEMPMNNNQNFTRREEEETESEESEPKMRGKGVALANEAINCLIRIPKNDPLRKRGFQIVTDWIKANK